MIEIGGYPIIWHIMKILSYQGINDFIICVGYKGFEIKNYFANYKINTNNFTVTIGEDNRIIFEDFSINENWNVTLVDTGLETQTALRIKKIKKYVGDETFLVTYGDGLSDVDLSKLTSAHLSSGLIGTVTAVKPAGRFGVLDISLDSKVNTFHEKPASETWVNGGFFLFNKEIFDYLEKDEPLEEGPLGNLADYGRASLSQ
jgi:glucose-1-phosphate cytidylyltransferase